MRIMFAFCGAALAFAVTPPAHAQVYVTSVTASFPDPNGKLPAFNVVPGAGIPSWSIGLAQAVLTQGQSYNYCVSLGTATANGKAAVSYKITQGSTVVQTHVIITGSKFSVGSNGVYYLCSGYYALPSSPGPATLTGSVSYLPKGATTPTVSKISAAILLN